MADVCKIDTKATHEDAVRMAEELTQGNMKFWDDIRTYNSPSKSCNVQQLVEDMAKIDKDDISIDYQKGTFRIDDWKVFSSKFIDGLNTANMTRSEVQAEIRKDVAVSDWGKLQQDFNSRATNLHLRFRLATNANSQLEVQDV